MANVDLTKYGITGTTGAPTETAGLDNAKVSEDIAKTNTSTVQSIKA